MGRTRIRDSLQTPWLDDIDGVNFDLIDVGKIIVREGNTSAILDLDGDHITPADGQEIGILNFKDTSSTGEERTYATLRGLIQDPTNTTEDGEFNLEVLKGGSLATYITINQADNDSISLNTHKLIGVVDPTIAQGVATKAYVDNFINGLIWKAPVQIATTVNITLSGEQTIDGVLSSTDRVLVKDQTDASENGIYVSAAGAWSRSTDADTGTELETSAVFIESGTISTNQAFVQVTPAPITIDVTDIEYVKFASIVQVGAGINLTKTDNIMDWDPTGGVDMLGNNLNNTGKISLDDGNTSFQQVGTTIQYDVDTAGSHLLRVNNVTEYDFDSTQFDIKGNNLIAMGILSFDDVNTSIKQISDDLQIDVAEAGKILFKTGGTTTLEIDKTTDFVKCNLDFSLEGNTIQFSADHTIRSSVTDTHYDVPTLGTHVLRVDDVAEYRFNAIELDLLGNRIRNASFLESSDTNVPASGFIRLGNAQNITWRNVGNTNDAEIVFTNLDDFHLKIDDQTEYGFSSTNSNWNGNDFLGVGNFTLNDTSNIIFNTTTGTKIGTAIDQKIGFWDAPPITQPAHIPNPTAGGVIDVQARVAIDLILAQLAATGLQASA